MRTFREILGKPSDALQAMVDGLREYSARSDFRIDMDTFGMVHNDVCFGCAATCAIQKATGKYLLDLKYNRLDGLWYNIKAEFFAVSKSELVAFENAINAARLGDVSSLLAYYGIIDNCIFDSRFKLLSDNWEQQLMAVVQVIAELRAVGL